MIGRQGLINTVATKLAKTTDYHMKPSIYTLTIKIVEMTTDENIDYVENTTERQWELYEIAVLEKAETLHWQKYHTLFN